MHPILGMVAAAALAASAPPPAGGAEVAVLVCRNFSSPPLAERSVPARGRSALRLLEECAQVETAFGGAFVSRINGLPAKGARDAGQAWFYYLNGILAERGAASCIPEPGDMLQWDLHLWDGVRQVRAIIGGYPHPFVQAARDGSLPPRVLFSPGAEAAARGLVSALARRGAAGVRVAPLAESEPPSDAPSLVIGPWDGIARVPLVKRSISDGARTGLFVDGGAAGMRRLDLAGTPRTSHPGAGALVAVVGGATRPAPLWLVTGTDTARACAAADVLISRPERIRGMASAVVAGDDVLPAPVIE